MTPGWAAVHVAPGLEGRERVALDVESFARHSDHDGEGRPGLALTVGAVAECLRDRLDVQAVRDMSAEAVSCHLFRHGERPYRTAGPRCGVTRGASNTASERLWRPGPCWRRGSPSPRSFPRPSSESAGSAGANDHHGTGCVVRDLVRHAAQQEAPAAVHALAADHDQ